MVIVHGRKRREKKLAQQSRLTLYGLNFLFSLHLALVSYFMATFLVARGFPQEFIGLLYAAGSIVTLFSLAIAPSILRKYGNYTNILVLGLLEFLAFIGLAVSHSLPVLFLLFILIFIFPTLISFSLDVFLEGATDEGTKTSGIRGTFLTIAALAWVAAPLAGGIIVQYGGYTALLVTAALLFSPFIIIASFRLSDFKDPQYMYLRIPNFMKTLKCDSNLRNVFGVQFLLRVFYAIMVIYLPLYIHDTLGMSLSDIGIIVAVATLAYVFLEIPLGKLQDSLWKEREVLIIGFVIISVTTATLSFITVSSVILWSLVLFATRVGAAMIEVGSEGYFFKHTKTCDADDVSAFRMLFPLAYIISPLVGTILLFFIPLNYIFFATAIVMLSGILFASALHDIK